MVPGCREDLLPGAFLDACCEDQAVLGASNLNNPRSHGGWVKTYYKTDSISIFGGNANYFAKIRVPGF